MWSTNGSTVLLLLIRRIKGHSLLLILSPMFLVSINNLSDDYGSSRGQKCSRNEQIKPNGEQSEIEGLTCDVPALPQVFRFTSYISFLLLLKKVLQI